MLQFLNRFENSRKGEMEEQIKYIKELMDTIEMQQDFTSYEFLPMLTLINMMCGLANKLRVESEMTQD